MPGRQSKIKKEADVREEVAVLSKVDHPHLAHIYERIETPTDIWLVLDLAEGGELLQHIMSRAPFEEADGAHITRQIVEGIEYLHRLGIVHRDLKPENILFKDPGSHDILITDFGFSRIVGSARCLETICGTPSYMAPEILSGSGHGLEVDMWAIGCITYAMLSGFLPFAADSQVDLFALIRSASFSFPDDLFSDVSSEAKDFISRCLVVAVGARPGSWDPVRIRAKEALRHPWLDIGAKLLDADPGDSMKISTARCKAPASLVLVVA
ncbi:myosin light chain kinase [Hyaloraphidium curvatum]|nr:myosin light chain kinase [Hyaloraphidium curvatum]